MSRIPYVGLHVTSGERRATAADIVASVQREIAGGGLPAGSRLPPVRALERQLGLSKNTAQAAYDELVARGLVEAREREGVFVLAAQRLATPPPIAAPPLPELVPPPLGRPDFPGPGMIPLSTVFIDPELLPTERIAECARSVLRERIPAQYEAQGYRPLREAIARRMTARGLEVTADEIVVTTGSQQSIDIVARSLVARRVAVESPVYGYAKLLFESLGHELVGLHLDPFRGLDLERWDRALSTGPALAYLISSFQNPTGYSYTSAELRGVLELAERHGVAILEDDWGSDMLSGSEYRPMLRMLGGKRVLYVNSFTKKLLPSLRIGFVAAAPELVPTLVAMKRLSTLGNAWLTEAVVAEFLDRGYYDTHLAALHDALDVRYAACLAALDELMPDGVRWTRPGGGPTLWLELPRSIDYATIEAYLARRGVYVSNASAAYVGPPHLHGFRISYAYLPEATMRAALTILADGIRTLATG
ncbi:MAG TPA: PLP-dependent aminotransferase family protein [Kofleriaceae bacterium]|nr:PLP-dependent aminotransferase family protein [Kofleriaceae bacterium]